MLKWAQTSDWAISLSWCGNFKSIPPECISICELKMEPAIAEHSMCHPGRPLPHGESHDGSPGFDIFHKAKSVSLRFSGDFSSVRAPSPSANALLSPN